MKDRWRLLAVCALFAFLPILFFKQYVFDRKIPLPFNLLVSFYSPWKFDTQDGYPLGVPNKPLGYDNLKLFYPLRKFTQEELSKGRVPLWNPYVFSGNVHAATYQAAVWYPFNVLYFFLPQMHAWSLLIIMQPILAAAFMFLFLRTLRLSIASSVFGSLTFAYSGWMIAMWQETLVLEHSFLWLPLALYASTMIWRHNRLALGIFLLCLSLTFSVLAGFFQMSLYTYLFTVCWNVYLFFGEKKRERRIRQGIWSLTAVILSLLVSAVQWIPALEAYFYSPRATVESRHIFEKFLSPFWHLVTLVAPDFFGNPGSYNYFEPLVYLQERTVFFGIPALVFVLFIFFGKRFGDSLFWKIAAIVSLSFGLSIPTSWIWYTLKIPVLSVAQPARIFALSTFCFAVLSAIGVERYIREKNTHGLRYAFGVLVAILAGLWIFALSQRIVISQRNLLLSTLEIFFLAAMFALIRKKKIVVLAAAAMLVFHSWNFSRKMLYFSEPRFEYPGHSVLTKLKELAGYDRIWSYGDGYITRNIPSYFGLYSPEGYDALYQGRYGKLLHTIRTAGMLSEQINRTDADLSETGQYETMTYNPYRLRLMSLLGVKYIVEYKVKEADAAVPPDLRFPGDSFALAWEDGLWRIWENKRALPRVWVAPGAKWFTDDQAMVNALYSPDTDLRQTVLLEGTNAGQPLTGKPDVSSASATITKYEPQKVELSVSTPAPSYVVLTDTYFPGWKAFVDDKQTKILRANYTFRAVAVSAGSHAIRYVYDPLSFRVGIAVSAVGIVGLLAVFLWQRNQNH